MVSVGGVANALGTVLEPVRVAGAASLRYVPRSPFTSGICRTIQSQPVLAECGAALIGMFARFAILIGAGQDDPGPRSFRWEWGLKL